ncbi:MAG: glyoxalase/bleomycin resistance/dioxygenase family protein, partial [Alphaproteobacteria bacterium]|nr:glyoxalase/bleomycin resistance/dioxygenase family protein [Alphaproteobacteria bacterium]
QVNDVDTAYERVIAAGFKTTNPPLTLRGGVARVIYIRAPEDQITEMVQYSEPAG